MTLENFFKAQWIVAHSTSRREIADLLAVCDRNLKDSRVPSLSDDGRFNLAYRAGAAAAQAALCAAGFKAERSRSHWVSIKSLEFTIRLPVEEVELFDAFRKKRNHAEYDATGLISKREADEMLQLAMRIRQKTEEWLNAEHSELM